MRLSTNNLLDFLDFKITRTGDKQIRELCFKVLPSVHLDAVGELEKQTVIIISQCTLISTDKWLDNCYFSENLK